MVWKTQLQRKFVQLVVMNTQWISSSDKSNKKQSNVLLAEKDVKKMIKNAHDYRENRNK